jgi:hypothetical protein
LEIIMKTKQKPSTNDAAAPKDLERRSANNMTATGISLAARQDAERLAAEETTKPVAKPKPAKKATTRKSPKQKAAEAATRATEAEATQDATPADTTPTVADTAPPPGCVTNPLPMACLADLFLGDLEQAGKSRGTVFGYSIDLALALKHFGKEAPATVLTTEAVAEFFESDAVTKTRTGKPKARPTVDKTRRVLRQVLAWGAENGYLLPVAIPAQYLPRAGAKAE